MGLTTGHVFSDGDTVTAAKLNAMVNDATITSDTITPAMIKDDAIESRHIADGAITSNHLTSGAVSIGAVESGQTTEGYLIQTDSSGDLTTLNVGASGTVLVSSGAETAPSFTTLGASGVSSAMISDHDKLESPVPSDLVFAKSISAGVNKRLEIQDLYRAVNGLTALSASDIADADEFLVLDAGTPKKITKPELASALNTTSESVAFARAKVSFTNMNTASGTASLSESNNIGSVSLDFTNSHYTLATLSFNSTASSVPTPIITAATARPVSGDTQSWYREVWVHSVSTTQLVIAVPGTSDVDSSEDDFVFYVAATL